MPFCKDCGTEVGPNDVFCKVCGTRLELPAGHQPEQLPPGDPPAPWGGSPVRPRPNLTVLVLSACLAVAIIAASFFGIKYAASASAISERDNNIASLNQQVTSLGQTIAGLTADKTSLQTQLTAAQQSVTSLNITITQLQASLKTAQDQLYDLQTKFPPKPFINESQLRTWVASHYPTLPTGLSPFQIQLHLQSMALSEGLIYSVGVLNDPSSPGGYFIVGVVVTSGNDIFWVYSDGTVVKIASSFS